MNLVDKVFEISELFMEKRQHVVIDYQRIGEISNTIKNEQKIIFPIPDVDSILKGIVLELVAASVNYCYWYGRHDVRPGNASSTRMYELLMESFSNFDYNSQISYESSISSFFSLLSENRFPMLQERAQHLNELKKDGLNFCHLVDLSNKQNTFEILFKTLIGLFPGFASDIFLKRASLFFLQLNRRFGWFEKELQNFFAPADYQIPKMLHHYKVIYYSDELKNMINNHQLIPKNSLYECEIRASTILSIKGICELTEWSVVDVDTYFFLKRHEAKSPFHLCITTDY